MKIRSFTRPNFYPGYLRGATGERIDKIFSLTSLTLSPHVYSGTPISLSFFFLSALTGYGEKNNMSEKGSDDHSFWSECQ
jgi:hypothetical protein